ncbi:MAG TPA: neprosin family prolyl endopeptidase, partial [Thermoanaerobaculia bacterium]|nr:neprosin family prolyl endopeptidase [Thermoanaerobaculia bacterium]
MRIRTILSGSLILLAALLRPAGAAIPLPPLDRTPAQWQRDFARLRSSDPEFRVASIAEFQRITAYYRDLVTDGIAEHSFRDRDGESIRCVSVATQRSFRESAPAGSAPRLGPVVPPSGGPALAASAIPGFGLDGSLDEDGNARTCPLLTFPQLVPRLENLYRFATLDAIFAKHPGGDGPPPPAPRFAAETETLEPPATAPTGHEYAHAYQYVNNIGTYAAFNIWSPAVQRNDEFSLAQMWVSNGQYADDTLQTVEAGWQVFPTLYGDAKAHLFIYTTSQAYAKGSGCYNLMCSRFVQTNSSIVIAGSFTTYSTVGGTQYELPLTVYRDPATGDWWLRFGTTWVGYYPSSLFDGAGLLDHAQKVDVGGEIVNDDVLGVHTTTDMGSGHFAEEGYKHAAYINNVTFWSADGAAFYPTALNPNATTPDAYDLQISYSDPSWHTYIFFGGP